MEKPEIKYQFTPYTNGKFKYNKDLHMNGKV